jgi:hypothetical protein
MDGTGASADAALFVLGASRASSIPARPAMMEYVSEKPMSAAQA